MSTITNPSDTNGLPSRQEARPPSHRSGVFVLAGISASDTEAIPLPVRVATADEVAEWIGAIQTGAIPFVVPSVVPTLPPPFSICDEIVEGRNYTQHPRSG